jgi:hypothetical protein
MNSCTGAQVRWRAYQGVLSQYRRPGRPGGPEGQDKADEEGRKGQRTGGAGRRAGSRTHAGGRAGERQRATPKDATSRRGQQVVRAEPRKHAARRAGARLQDESRKGRDTPARASEQRGPAGRAKPQEGDQASDKEAVEGLQRREHQTVVTGGCRKEPTGGWAAGLPESSEGRRAGRHSGELSCGSEAAERRPPRGARAARWR